MNKLISIMKALSAFIFILSFVSAIGTSAAIIPMFVFTGRIDIFLYTLIAMTVCAVSGIIFLMLEKL